MSKKSKEELIPYYFNGAWVKDLTWNEFVEIDMSKSGCHSIHISGTYECRDEIHPGELKAQKIIKSKNK